MEGKWDGPRMDADLRRQLVQAERHAIHLGDCLEAKNTRLEAAQGLIRHLEQQLAAVTAERDALRRDAERYQFLKAKNVAAVIATAWGLSAKACEYGADQVDAAVDAAIAAASPQSPASGKSS